MDDFVISNLHEARNEWCSRLVSIFTPLIIDGIRSIFNEAWSLCNQTNEPNKYLMTFQNLLSRVPKWNSIIIEDERTRIIEKSGCNYLEDLITCVHIIQLKVLTSIRVGNKQKKIDISIPKLDGFIHKVYIHTARKIFMNVYLFDKTAAPLQQQKHNRELEIIVQECIMVAIRESIPTEEIIRAYLDESIEQEEEVIIENIDEPVDSSGGGEGKGEGEEGGEEAEAEKEGRGKEGEGEGENSDSEEVPDTIPSIKNIDNEPVISRLTFNDYDSILTGEDKEETVEAPKSIERLEEISRANHMQRKLEEEQEDLEGRIKINTTDKVELDDLDIFDIEGKPIYETPIVLEGVEEL